MIFPGPATLEILQKIQEDRNALRINPEQSEGIILFMSMFNDIDWTKEGKFFRQFVEFREGKRLRKKGSRADIGHSSVHEKKTNGVERTLTNLKENGMKSLMSWSKISKVDIQYSEVQVH